MLGYNLWRVHRTQSPSSKPKAGLPLEDPSRMIFLLSFFFPLFLPCCVVFIPRPGSEPVSPTVEAWSLNHWTTRAVPDLSSLTRSPSEVGHSLAHVGQGSRDNAPVLKYLHMQKWHLHFDEEHKAKNLSLPLTFSKCQVPIRGERADSRIWICFFGGVTIILKISLDVFWNNLLVLLVSLMLIPWILSCPIRLCCCIQTALAKATGGLQIARFSGQFAVTLLFIPAAFSTLTFLEHFILLALVSLSWFSTYSLEAIYNLLFLLLCLCSLLFYAPTIESAIHALISGFPWRGRVLRDHRLGARGVFFFF